MPDCVIEVIIHNHNTIKPIFSMYLQDIRRRYPSHDGLYRDYLSTYDASIDYEDNDDDSMA